MKQLFNSSDKECYSDIETALKYRIFDINQKVML